MVGRGSNFHVPLTKKWFFVGVFSLDFLEEKIIVLFLDPAPAIVFFFLTSVDV